MRYKIKRPDIRYTFVETPGEAEGHRKRIEIVLSDNVENHEFEVEFRLCECAFGFLEKMVDNYRKWIKEDTLPGMEKLGVKHKNDETLYIR